METDTVTQDGDIAGLALLKEAAQKHVGGAELKDYFKFFIFVILFFGRMN